MIHFTDATGLLGSAIAIVAVSSRMLGVFRLPRARLGWLLVTVFVATLFPIGGLPLAGYLRGTIGDLSITSLLLLFMAFLRSLRGWPTPPDRNKLLLLNVFTAVGFYPLALGWGGFDPYRLGYGSYWFLACLLGLALLLVFRRLSTIAFTIGLAVLAWSIGWYESTNIWDYLLDPMISIYAAVAIIRQGIRRLRAG
ncbi:MAG TPA: hypothetical protein VKG67_06340 [Gallionellaceae bacterium]|nr:hypothetical protein [Gallionellaceae bacterium]